MDVPEGPPDQSPSLPRHPERALLAAIVERAVLDGEAMHVADTHGNPAWGTRIRANGQWWLLDDPRDEAVWGSAAFIANELGLEREWLAAGARARWRTSGTLVDVETRDALGNGALHCWIAEARPVSAPQALGPSYNGTELIAVPAGASAAGPDWSWDAIVRRDILAEIRAEALAELGLVAPTSLDDPTEDLWERVVPRVIQAVANAHQVGRVSVVLGDPLRSPATRSRQERARRWVLAILASLGIEAEDAAAALGLGPSAVDAALAWLWMTPARFRAAAQLVGGLALAGVLPAEVHARWGQGAEMLAAVPAVAWARARSRRSYWKHQKRRVEAAQRWRERNRARHVTAQREKYHAQKGTPAFIAMRRRQRRREREQHGERVRARARAWYAANKVRVQAERRAQMTEADREAARRRARAQRQRKLAARARAAADELGERAA